MDGEETLTAEELGVVGSHKTATTDRPWDGAANEARLPSPMPIVTARAGYAWIDSASVEDGKVRKDSCKFLHHQVSADGTPGAANTVACSAVIANLNGGRTPPNIPDSGQKGVHAHVAAHLRDAKKEVPPLKNSVEKTEKADQIERSQETFASVSSAIPSTLNEQERTIDVCWYAGASVPRLDRATGEEYNLRLDPMGCRMERLNAGGAIFDSHMAGMDFPSAMDGRLGMKAQVGVVLKAWVENKKCYATLKFDDPGEPEEDGVWRKVSTGIARNLSFGCWIYQKEDAEPKKAENGQSSGNFVATDWEPFEISVVSVPADFGTEFLHAAGTEPESRTEELIVPATPASSAPSVSASSVSSAATDLLQEISTAAKSLADSFSSALNVVSTRATAQQEGNHMAQEKTDAVTGAEARVTPPAPPAISEEQVQQVAKKAADEAALAATSAERLRVSDIRKLSAKFPAIEQTFADTLIEKGVSVEEAGRQILNRLADQSEATMVSTVAVLRDQTDTRRAQMEAALLHRIDPRKYPIKEEFGKQYAYMTLCDMGRECLLSAGINPKRLNIPRSELARVALQGRHFGSDEYFVGAQGNSDFPSILANVATKIMRIAYEAAPRTFLPFTRRMSAPDFKQIYLPQLSDIPVMAKVDENGEFKQANLSDSRETLQVLTYGQIVNITRQAIVNDNLAVLDSIPTRIGRGAGTLENSVVWAIITGNAAMYDTVAIFHATHANLETGGNSALGLTGLTNARKAMRIQTGPKSNILNLVPASIAVPAALEVTMLQLLFPLQFAPTAAASVIPEQIRNLTPIVEPLLDSNSTAYWYLFGDPAMIDIVGYAYLEGQEGVYTEVKQGFEVDGVQVKGRLDFGAAMMDHRGAVRSNGA